MAPKKAQKKAVPQFPPAKSGFKYNQGFRYGIGDNPPQLNQIPVPTGANGCLLGINFVVTGTLPSLTREGMKDLIEKYGGKMTSSISGKTDVVIRGVIEVGAKKIQEAESRGIQITDQEGFFEYIASTNPAYAKSTPAAAPVSAPAPPPQPPKEETKKNSKSKGKTDTKDENEERISKILANLEKPTSSFTYFQGYHYGIGDNPPQHNQIPIPIGSNGCLLGLNIVPTGQMPSLTIGEMKDLIEKYGGTHQKNITKKTHLVVRGCSDVSEKKMDEAKQKKIPIVDQAGFFKIIENSKQQTAAAPQEVTAAPTAATETVEYGETYPSSLFSEKYRPRSLKEVVGNSMAIGQLKYLLENFGKVKNKAKSDDKNKAVKPKPLILVSGPSGVGKTTSVHLACKELNFVVTEFNASQKRQKDFIDSITASTSNLSFDNASICNQKHAIVLEDIEDMSRSFSLLVNLATSSKIPIICISNEIDDKKFETILNASTCVNFTSPSVDEIKSRLAQIAKRENLEISEKELESIAQSSRGDVRYAINNLQFWGCWDDRLSSEGTKNESISNIIEASLAVLSTANPTERKVDAFFFDSSQVPLYVQQNLPMPAKFDQSFQNYADALDFISEGDLIGSCISLTQDYKLLNAQAIFSSVGPSNLVKADVRYLVMPKIYTADKKQQKLQRYITEIGERIQTSSMQPKAEIFDSFSALLVSFLKFLLNKDPNKLLNFIDALSLSPDDLDHVNELITFVKNKKDKELKLQPLSKIYKAKHSDDPKKIKSQNDFRALHLVRQTKGKTKAIK